MTQVSGSTQDSTPGVIGTNTGGATGVRGEGYYGGVGVATSNWGCGVWGQMAYTNGAGVSATATGTDSFGLWAQATNGHGAKGESTNASYNGVWGNNTSTTGGAGVKGSGFYGVWGESNASSGTGVTGTGSCVGVKGINTGTSGSGVYGYNTSGCTSGWAIWGYDAHNGANSRAGYFNGKVDVNGTLFKTAGSFKIDHPLDPENKYLIHSFVESDEMKNVYDGSATLDSNGEALIEFPNWFDALNDKCTIKAFPIGCSMKDLFGVKLGNGKFKLSGGVAGGAVDWTVTGVRKDAYAIANPMPVEVDKEDDLKGTYLHPECHGHDDTKSALKKMLSKK